MAKRFETEILVRPSDVDAMGHVHSSVYLDYILAARYDQTERCYEIPFSELESLGYAWVVRSVSLEYRSPLRMGDTAVVLTWVGEIGRSTVEVFFEIMRKGTNRPVAAGVVKYAFVNRETGKPARIPESIMSRYSV